jgi:nitroreductase
MEAVGETAAATSSTGAFDIAAVDRLLTTTRMVRRRLDLERSVPVDVVRRCIEIAVQAPNGSNLQLWRWIVVTDPALRASLADCYRRGVAKYLNVMLEQAKQQADLERIYLSSQHLADVMGQVPVLVVPCMTIRPEGVGAVLGDMGYELSDVHTASTVFYGSIWPAIWSFVLALRSRGLASAVTTMHLAVESEAGELLGIPADAAQLGIVAVAYPLGQDFRPARRKPVGEVLSTNGWT